MSATHSDSLSYTTAPPDAFRLLDGIVEGVCGLNTAGNITFLNRSAARMLNLDPNTAVGQSLHALTHPCKADGTPFSAEECPLCRSFRAIEGAVVGHEVFWRPDRTSFPVAYSAQPLRTGDLIDGAVLTFSDISNRQIHAQELLRILTGARCLLWYADLHYIREKRRMRWFLQPADEVAARRFLPFPVAEGQSFGEAFYACRLDADKRTTDTCGTQHILAARTTSRSTGAVARTVRSAGSPKMSGSKRSPRTAGAPLASAPTSPN